MAAGSSSWQQPLSLQLHPVLTKDTEGISTDFSGLLFSLDVSLTFAIEDKALMKLSKHLDTPVKVWFRGERCSLFMFVSMGVFVL